MRKNLLFISLLILCCSSTINFPPLKNGVYRRSNEWTFMTNPHLKIDGDTFKLYDYGHTVSEYGWGTYKINNKDSTVTFFYKEYHGTRFYPLKNYRKTEKLIIEDTLIIIEGYKTDSSETMNKYYDSLFLDCKIYVDKAFLINKKRKRVKRLTKKDW